MTIITEGGLLPSRIEYVAEDTQGVTPANPSWEMPSERVSEFDPGYTLNYSEDSGLGEVDFTRDPTTEETEMSMTYALQRWLLDGAGTLQDMASYGLVRAANRLPASLSVVRRIESGDLNPDFGNAPLVQPASTVDARYNPASATDGSGSTAKVSRAYDVLKGVDVGESTATAERGNTAWEMELTCPAEHGRSYRIDQPTASTDLLVWSTDAGDTGYTVTIEDEGAATSETVSLDATNATTQVLTANSYANIDAIQIEDPNGNVISEDSDTYVGNIVVAVNAGTATSPAEGEWLTVMWGSAEYENTYGDPGIPPLGTGAHASAISAAGERPSYYRPQNMSVERPVGDAIEHAGGVQSVELSVGNNVERIPSGGREQRQHHGMRGVEVSITVDGETVGTHLNNEMVRGEEETSRLLFNRAGDEYVDLESAVVSETDTADSAGENSPEREFTVLAQIGPDGEPAIAISAAGSGP